MVSRGDGAMSLLSNLRNRLRNTPHPPEPVVVEPPVIQAPTPVQPPLTVKNIELQFELDRDAKQHRVHIGKDINGIVSPVETLDELARPGYIETHIFQDEPTVFQLSGHDLQILFALRSMNPKHDGDGWWEFAFAPPILDYLRQKPNIEETEASSALHIEKEPLKPAARIDYNPKKGMIVETGYEQTESEKLVPLTDLPRTQDGQYVVMGDAFRPIVTPKNANVRELLQSGRTVIDLDDIPEFFKRDLVLIKKEFDAVLTDTATRIDVLPGKAQSYVRVNKTRQGWLDFDVRFTVGSVEIPWDLLPKQGGVQYIQINEMTWAKVDAREVAKTQREMDRLDAEVTASGYRLPVAQFASVEDFVEKLGGKSELNNAYRDFLAQLNGFEPDTTFKLTKRAEETLADEHITLRPYQRSGIHWLNWLQSHHLHGILADDMGLGKTLQTIVQLRLAYERSLSSQHTLIVAPRSVLHHWERELSRFFPNARTYRYHGSGRKHQYLHAYEPIIFISTYSTVSRDIDRLKLIPFLYVILDEASYIKNPNSTRAKAAKALNATHRLALTGTPVENRPSEIWSLFDFVMRGHLGRYTTFGKVFENPISAGDNQAANRLGQRIKPFVLRRLKEEVARDLPDKIELDEWCELSSEQRDLYQGLQDGMKQVYRDLRAGRQVNYAASILPVLTKLKQICDHPAIVTKDDKKVLGRSNKFDWIVDKIQEIREADEQVVIFSHFLDMLTLLEKACHQKGWSYIRLDGSVSNRQPLIDRFNASKVPIALCSIRATGYGINLTAANHVIHADRWWNPAVEDQATDRVHRIGQDKTVYVYRILVENSLEERIDNLLTEKRIVASSIMGATRSGARAWSREELLEILKPID